MRTYGSFAGVPAVNNQATLNPRFFGSDNILKNNIKYGIENRAEAFVKKLGLSPKDIEDIRLVGGNSSYDWTDNSDLDVTIMIDRNKNYSKKEIRALGLATSLLNYKLSPSIDGVDLNFFISSRNLGGLRPTKQSIYSLKQNKHIKGPYNNPESEPNFITGKAEYFSQMIENCIEDEDNDRGDCAKKLLQKLRAYRAKGLASKEGEFSTPNAVWRLLSRSGYIEILKNKVDQIEKDYYRLSTEGPRSIVTNDEYRQFVQRDPGTDLVPHSMVNLNKRILQGYNPTDMLNRVKPILSLFGNS
jgi:hypothetical protein